MHSRGKIITRLIYGLGQLSSQASTGDILITAARSSAFNGVEFSKAINLFKQRVLRRLFTKGVAVVTRSDFGRLHSHVAVDMLVPGFDFDWLSFDQSESYYKLYKKYKTRDYLKLYRYFTVKYRRSLPAEWQVINHKLMAAGKKYGLGRIFLTPIRKNMTAYKWYLVSNVPYKRETTDKGLHFFYSWGMKTTGQFQVISNFTSSYRTRLKQFAQGLLLTPENYIIILRSVLGKSWYFRTKDIIKNIENLSPELARQYNELKSSINTYFLRAS